MSDITQSLKHHRRQHNMLRKSRMSLEKGKFIGPYEIIDFLKEGSSSKIYLAKSLYTNENVIIKAINKSHFLSNLDDLLLITKQIETLKILKHRNIVTLYEIYESNKYIYLITEYCSGKDLIEKIIRKKRFNEEEALLIFFQLLDAFTYMHKMNICHRNIRTEHILFDKNNRPKIVGFGYSSFYEKNKKVEGAFGSLCYACPEIIDEQPYDPELADVWSLGVILYVIICGYLPFSDEDDNKNKILISEGKIEFPKEISNKLKDLLRHMLDKDPKKRYTFQKVVKHPWIKPYSESFFSQGINIYKTIFPVEEKILNIIHEFNFDRKEVKNDLISNKYNTGTGLYKQIVRKLMDKKIKNISDLFSEEFNEYRDNKENKYDNGDERYEQYIQKVAEKYNKREEFVNEFKEREEQIVEKLLTIKEQKDAEKNKLNIINEEKEKEKEEENNNENNNENNDNIEIVYNNEQDIDIIGQFKEEQNKKFEEQISEDKPMKNKEEITDNKNPPIDNKSLRLTSTSETSKTDPATIHQLINKSKTNSFLISPVFNSLANSNLLKSTSNDIKPTKTLNQNDFRMTAIRKTKTRSYFDRGSLYDDFLKKSHPENVRKTMLKSKFSNIYENIDQDAIEGIKEKDETESENEEKKENELKLKYSFNFDDDEEDEENNQNDDDGDVLDVIDRDGEDKLFEMFNNDDDEEIKELKKLYYGDNLKQSIKLLKKSIKKKKSVKFKDDVNIKEKKERNNEIKRVGTNNSGLDIDKLEEKLNEYNKNLGVNNDKELNLGKIKLYSELELKPQEEEDKKPKEEILYYINDKEYTKRIDLERNKDMNNINDINNLLQRNYLFKYNKALPCKKIEVIGDKNDIEFINVLFHKKNKQNSSKEKTSNKNKKDDIQLKKDESTQTNLIIKNKFRITRTYFNIRSTNNNQKNFSDNENYQYLYNGNNQVNMKKYNNPIRLNYNRNKMIQNKTKEFNTNEKLVKYFKKKSNVTIDTDKIKNNISFNREKTPKFMNKFNTNNDFMDLSSNLTSKNKLSNFNVQNNNNSYIKNIYNFDEEYDNYNYHKTIPRQKSAYNSDKNIKNEVIVKRNEIIEKIQHCQNLLNTIMIDKKYSKNNMKNINYNNNSFDNINNNLLTFNKQNPRISELDMNKPKQKLNFMNNNKGINQIYKKNNIDINVTNPNRMKKYTYKRINFKNLDKSNDIYNFDNISRDNTYNTISLTVNKNNNFFNDINNNTSYYKKKFNNKRINNYLDDEINLNNYSFDVPHTISENTNYNFNTYMKLNQRKQSDNQTNTYKMNNNYMNSAYRNNNININNTNPIIKKNKGF